VAKYRDAFYKNQTRYEKAKIAYQKLLEKLELKSNKPKGLQQILDDNFCLSEYNPIFALSAALA
jgi:hypothetical protein